MELNKTFYKKLINTLKNPKKLTEEAEEIAAFLLKIEDLTPYISSLSALSLEQVAGNLKLHEYKESEVVFNKGDNSDKLFIVIKGSVSLYDVQKDDLLSLVSVVEMGKVLGERGLIRSMPRSLTAIAKRNTILISFDIMKFKYIINSQLNSNIDEKLNFIDQKFPKSSVFKTYQKEKLAYCIDIKAVKKDEVIVREGTLCENLIFMYSGECLVYKSVSGIQLKIIYIGPGCMISEECVLLNKHSEYSYKISSDKAKLYYIKKQDFFIQTPEQIVRKLIAICKIKLNRRIEIMQGADRIFKYSNPIPAISVNSFPLANRKLRSKLSDSFYQVSTTKLPSLETAEKLSHTKAKLIKLRDRTKLSHKLSVSNSSPLLSKSYF